MCGDPRLTKSAKEKYIGTLCGSRGQCIECRNNENYYKNNTQLCDDMNCIYSRAEDPAYFLEEKIGLDKDEKVPEEEAPLPSVDWLEAQEEEAEPEEEDVFLKNLQVNPKDPCRSYNIVSDCWDQEECKYNPRQGCTELVGDENQAELKRVWDKREEDERLQLERALEEEVKEEEAEVPSKPYDDFPRINAASSYPTSKEGYQCIGNCTIQDHGNIYQNLCSCNTAPYKSQGGWGPYVGLGSLR